MKSKDLQSRLLYPAKLSFRIEGQIKSFPDKKKKILKEFIITKNKKNRDRIMDMESVLMAARWE